MRRTSRQLFRPWLGLAWGAVGVLCGGCANVATTQSGFLGDYAVLRPTGESGPHVYRQPGLMPLDYRQVIIEPTVLRLGAKDATKLTPQDAAELSAHCDAALRKVLGTGREIVAEPTGAALRVRAAITGVDTSSPALNAVTGVLFWPLDNGGVSVEFEVVEAGNGERLVALVAASAGTPLQVIGSFSKLGHARSGIDRWTTELGKLLAGDMAAAAH